MKENIMIIPNNNNLLEKELNNPKKYFDNVFDCFISEIKKDLIIHNIKLFKFEKTELQVIWNVEHIWQILKISLTIIKQEEYKNVTKTN